jgi:hypothetical protein
MATGEEISRQIACAGLSVVQRLYGATGEEVSRAACTAACAVRCCMHLYDSSLFIGCMVQQGNRYGCADQCMAPPRVRGAAVHHVLGV